MAAAASGDIPRAAHPLIAPPPELTLFPGIPRMHKHPISLLLPLAHGQGLTTRIGVALPARATLGRPVTALFGTAHLSVSISQNPSSISQITLTASFIA